MSALRASPAAWCDVNYPPGSYLEAVIGENGAGKSTFAKIISCVILPDEGTIYYLDG